MATPHVQRWIVTQRMATDYTTWRATSMNGVQTGGTLITIAKARPRTRPGRTRAHPGCCAEGLGVTVLVALRVANRLYDFPNKRDVNRGFRCVVSGPDNP